MKVSGFTFLRNGTILGYPYIESLKSFPLAAQAFCKSNCTLPNSAAVERLFSAASQVLTARRYKMADETFDKLVFLRITIAIQVWTVCRPLTKKLHELM